MADHAAVRACMLEVFLESAARKRAAEMGRALWEWQYLKGENERSSHSPRTPAGCAAITMRCSCRCETADRPFRER